MADSYFNTLGGRLWRAFSRVVSGKTVYEALFIVTDSVDDEQARVLTVTPAAADGALAVRPVMYGTAVTYVVVNQSSAGTTELSAASVGKRHRVVSAVLSINAAGSLKFADGGADLTGPLPVVESGGFVLPAGTFPYFVTAVNSALNIVTTGGAVRGVVGFVTE
jgi:hypothetical protein